MAFKTVSQLKDSVAAILSGIDLGNVDNLNGAFERAARVFVQKAKIPEAQGTQNLTMYSGVTDYAINTKIFGTSINDIRPQGISRWAGDFVYKKFANDWDREKAYITLGTMATFAYNLGTPIIRVVTSHTPPRLILDPMSDTTGWTAGGSASGLAQDQSFYYQAPASLRFNLAAAGSQGYLEKTITSADLTSYQSAGVVFVAVEMPSTNITSVGIRIGSDSSNYYSMINTAPTIGSFVSGQFMLIPLDLASAMTVGSPNIAAIDYVRVFFNYNGTAMTNVRAGYLFASLPTPMQILYNSAGLFLGTDGTVSTSITSVSDQIITNDAAYTIYEYECALAVMQQTGGGMSDSMTARLDGILNGNGRVLGLYDSYRNENPSEQLRLAGNYYDNDLPY